MKTKIKKQTTTKSFNFQTKYLRKSEREHFCLANCSNMLKMERLKMERKGYPSFSYRWWLIRWNVEYYFSKHIELHPKMTEKDIHKFQMEIYIYISIHDCWLLISTRPTHPPWKFHVYYHEQNKIDNQKVSFNQIKLSLSWYFCVYIYTWIRAKCAHVTWLLLAQLS